MTDLRKPVEPWDTEWAATRAAACSQRAEALEEMDTSEERKSA